MRYLVIKKYCYINAMDGEQDDEQESMGFDDLDEILNDDNEQEANDIDVESTMKETITKKLFEKGII